MKTWLYSALHQVFISTKFLDTGLIFLKSFEVSALEQEPDQKIKINIITHTKDESLDLSLRGDEDELRLDLELLLDLGFEEDDDDVADAVVCL